MQVLEPKWRFGNQRGPALATASTRGCVGQHVRAEPAAWDTQCPPGIGTSRSGRQEGRLPHGGRSRDGRSRQDRWADDRAWTVSWMRMNRIDQYSGRGSGSSSRDQKNPRQRDGFGGEPNEHPDGQNPRRGSRPQHDEARDSDGQPEVPHSEGPDSHPPVSVVLQFRRLGHARDCSTVARYR